VPEIKHNTSPLQRFFVLFGGMIAVYCENYTKPTNMLCGKNAELLGVEESGA
jgi:hypothetical protein